MTMLDIIILPMQTLITNQSALQQANPCPTVFCGCQSMGNPFLITNEVNVTAKVYFMILYLIVIIIAGVKMVLEWFIFKDYYPLKQKSPILCILLILSICGQLMLYPTLYLTHYFTAMFNNESTRFVFRAFQSGLEYSVFIIYIVRSMRISYAHDTHSSRNKSIAFKIFHKQYLLALLICALCLVKFAVVVLHRIKNSDDNDGNKIKQFALYVQLQTPMFNREHLLDQMQYLLRGTIAGFFWHCVLCYCMWLHKSVNERYTMKYEIMLIIVSDLVTMILNINLLAFGVFDKDPEIQQARPILDRYCQIQSYYPASQVIKIINLVLILAVSIIKPLTERKIYHQLLPTGRHYGFIKTMRDFLMEQQFLRVFTKYLEYLDKISGNGMNITLLEFWKKMIVLKINRKQPELQKLENIKKLIEDVKDILFINQSELIINLKDSILGLEQSISNSDKITQKYRQSINEKVDQLQKIALERLDRIYMKNYSQTESYFHLKKLTDDYKRVNLNMIMLNLALIVDSENQFT